MFGLQKYLLPVGALFLAGAAACVATRNPDGSYELEFAPDMTITAWGLEDALEKLTELLDKCITGNFDRPCTKGEMAEINKAMQNVLERKVYLRQDHSPGSAPTLVM